VRPPPGGSRAHRQGRVRFLLDTGATTVLNLKSFTGGQNREIQVTSWTGAAATSAREVSVKEMSIGNHHLRDLKLPAIDLSPIGNACGGPIDGILGVDLLDKMEVSIDLKRQVASLGADPVDPKAVYDEMEKSMGHCTADFEQGKADEFEKCLDPEIVLYIPDRKYLRISARHSGSSQDRPRNGHVPKNGRALAHPEYVQLDVASAGRRGSVMLLLSQC
jgi:hypothetical protein